MENFQAHIENREPAGSMKADRFPAPLAVSLLFLIVLSLMILSSLFTGNISVKSPNYYTYMFLAEALTIGIPPLVYIFVKRINIRQTIRLHKISIPEILLIIGMAVFGYGILIPINLVWVWFLSKFGTPQTTELPLIENGMQLLTAILVIGVTPALVEEFLFRGVMQRGYERIGKKAAIVITGLLFAFLHVSVVSIPSIILLGILLCYINYRSNSIWGGVIYHFVYNSIAVLLSFVQGILSKFLPMEGPETLAEIPPQQMAAILMVWGFLGVIAFILFLSCFAGFQRLSRGKQQAIAQENKTAGQVILQLLPAVLAVAVIIVLLVFEIIQMVNPVPVG